MNPRYMRLVRGGFRAIGRIGKWAGVCVLIAGGAVAGIVASLVVGGMGLALMGTAIGIGPIGWVGIMVIAVLAVYGGICLLKRR